MNIIDIRNKEKDLTFKLLWIKDKFTKLRADPELNEYSNDELKQYLLSEYEKRKIINGRLFNNATNENIIMNQEQFINEYLNKPYILSGYSCFYLDQDHKTNISSAALENLGDMRKKYKKKMEAAEHGSNEYIYYRILQLTYKVLMNSYYGILGEKNSVFYNPFVQNSITTTSQDLITTTIIALEAFLSNNVKFETTDDIITFLINIKNEKYNFNILDFINEPIGKSDLLDYLISHSRDPEKINKDIIQAYINNFSTELINRCYYKNQLDKLLSNNYFINKLKKIMEFECSGEIADEIKDEFEDFRNKLLEFCFYDYLFEDRYKRAMKDTRRTVTVIDTDSTFININQHIEFINELIPIDKTKENTLLNLLINIVTEMLRRTFLTLTTSMGLLDRAKPIINMKQEFVYKRILLTKNKKNYAGIITSELGKILSHPELDIKGLPILKKTSVPKVLRKRFTKIVEEDILKADTINLKKILDKYDEIELSIKDSLKERKVEYLLPKNLELIDKYKIPDTVEAVRGTIIWNALEPENQIVPPEKINLLKLNGFDISDPRFEEMKNKYPEKYDIISKIVFNIGVANPKLDISRFGFSCIAIPKDITEIPEYLMPFIDYKSMVNVNLSSSYILLESLGIYVEEVDTVTYKSNIVQI